ncbi:MAG: ferredoxin, partial [bacterium]
MITFKKSNIVVKKYNKNDTLLDIAEENGVLIDFGCRSLMCSSCIVKTDGNIEVEPSD